MRPICFYCQEKPVKWSKHFCSQRCAAKEGQDQATAAYQWCDECKKEGQDVGYGVGWADTGHEHGKALYDTPEDLPRGG